MALEHVGIYLNDHLAGANLALETVDRLAEENHAMGTVLRNLKVEIESDREQLRSLMLHLGITESQVRQFSSYLAETVSEAKLGVDDDSFGSLRRLQRLEMLALGIQGKLALWQSLKASKPGNPDLAGPDYEQLSHRAIQQRDQVEAWRLQAAQTALLRSPIR